MLAANVEAAGAQAIVAVYSLVSVIVDTGVAPVTGAVTPAIGFVVIAIRATFAVASLVTVSP